MLITFLLTMGIISICVVIHYEALYRLGSFVEELRISPRQQVVVGVLLALAAHVVEIYIFAGGYYYALYYGTIGGFTGEAPMENYFDCVYLSFVTYSTLGFGDIIPHGGVRFMVGVEAMVGLVQIAWTASYLFMQMEQKWGHSAVSGPVASRKGSRRGNSRE
jgi:hypothetical protein